MRASKARMGVEALEGRSLMAATAFFMDQATRVVDDTVGSVDVNVSTMLGGPNEAPTPITLTVATGGGTAVPGVDYTPVRETFTVTPSSMDGSARISIPILPGPAGLGTRVLRVAIEPASLAPGVEPEAIVITHGVDRTPPSVAAMPRALTQGGKVVAFAIPFSEPLAPGPAADPANYVVAGLKSPRDLMGAIFGPGGTVSYRNVIPLKAAVYDAPTSTVYLIPANPVKPVRISRLAGKGGFGFQVGTPPGGGFSNLTDPTGNPVSALPGSVSSGTDDVGHFVQFAREVPASPAVLATLFGTATPAPAKGHAGGGRKAK